MNLVNGPSGGKIYLFGGRLVTTRRMVNDMYVLDLLTLEWSRHTSSTDAPQPRYFHSCDLWNGKLVIFGGMGYIQGNESELCVLNEVVAFDPATGEWDAAFSQLEGQAEDMIPEPRYAHLSSVTAHSLVIVGGQDMANHYVEVINVFDLHKRQWIVSQPLPKQRGSYRSLAVGPTWTVDDQLPSGRKVDTSASMSTPRDGGNASLLSASNISLLPTSKKSWTEGGRERRLPIYVYTNYNFTDVRREMELVDFHDDDGPQPLAGEDFSVEDQSGSMSGTSLPPGLRFPTGAMLGSHLLISGTYLANTSQTFAIWALYLPKMTWSRLDVGPLLSTGSWNRGVLWPSQSRLLVFGNRDRDLVSDYNHRQTNWDHVLVLELEAWGITQPPICTVSRAATELGLEKLASSVLGSLSHSLPSQGTATYDDEHSSGLVLGGRGDFEIVCSDGMRLGCDRAVLERQWPWFAAQMGSYRRQVTLAARKVHKQGGNGAVPDSIASFLEASGEEGKENLAASSSRKAADPRTTPRQLVIAEPSPVILALLIFFYTRCICTSLQRHPAIVAALLVVSKVYGLEELELWAKHAAHVSLASDLSPPIIDIGSPASPSIPSSSSHFSFLPLERHRLAVALYEAATMCGFEALQIRALRTVMSVAKWVQRSSNQSHKSSTTNTADSSGEGLGVQTSTTSTLFPDTVHASLGDTPSTAVTSPGSSKRSSVGRGEFSKTSLDGDEATAAKVLRRPSKAERMLGMSGADIASSATSLGRPEKMLGMPSPDGSQRSTAPNRAASHPSVTTAAYPPTPVAGNVRRPSAPVTSPSSQLGNRTASLPLEQSRGGPVSGNRKRFSIFGRTNEATKSTNTLAKEHYVGDAPLENVRNSTDRPPPISARGTIHRTNTNGTDESSSRSFSSLQPSDTTTGSGALPPPAFSDKDMKRIEREGTRGKLTTLTRLKASALKSIDTSLSNGLNAPANGNGSSHAQPSNSSVSPSVPSLTEQVRTPSSNESGKLNERELKALYSIWS